MMAARTPVLVVGGSLNGLTMALLLSRRGVPCLVVERHARTAIQYKFRGISPRSMEIYRSAGIEAEIRARDLIDDTAAYVARMKNLGDGEVAWLGIPWSNTSAFGPTAAATCDQDQLEPILRANAARHGADVRFATELIDFSQGHDPDGAALLRPDGIVACHLRNAGGDAQRALDEAFASVLARQEAHADVRAV